MSVNLSSLFPECVDMDVVVTGVTQDSRAVEPGFVFFAIKGVATDGAKYISQAISAGAIAVVAPRSAFVNGVPHIVRHYPARALALAAKAFYGAHSETIVAVTGTNGKSSTVDFLRQIWTSSGVSSASIGTLGAVDPAGKVALGFTTPTAEKLHQVLARLAEQGVSHCAMEASSHGLAQYRMDGVNLACVAFTNFTQDHLDYHTDMSGYRAAKLRLFTELAPENCPAILNADDPNVSYFELAALSVGLRPFSFGWKGRDLKLEELSPKGTGQNLKLIYHGQAYNIDLPLIGEFQALNALTAAACALATGIEAEDVFDALAHLTPVKGRLEHVGQTENGGEVFVDFAHTPDGLDTVLRAIRPHTMGALYCVFGCGGDRDASKRPLMGAVAGKLADYCVITDDNPRSEDPSKIRANILAGYADAVVIPDRAEAIATTLSQLSVGDVLVVAGKGHETGQIIGDTIHPFSDQECIRTVLTGGIKAPLWTSDEIAEATGAKIAEAFDVASLSIDTRSSEAGALFVALQDVRDGHDFVDKAAERGASAALVSKSVDGLPRVRVPDVLEALTDMAEAARERCAATRYAVTGSVGKTSVKEMLAQIFRRFGSAHWPEKSFNNHWGVPLTLARMPRDTQNAVFEIGMSTPGEIAPRSRMVKPHIAIITRIADAHLEGLGSLEAVATEKAAVFAGLEADGKLILPRDDVYFDRLSTMGRQRAPDGTILSFGMSDDSTAQFLGSEPTPKGEAYRIKLDSQVFEVEIAARGNHWGLNIAAALLAARAGNLDVATAARALCGYAPPQGRGTIENLNILDIGSVTLMDDSYNANPTSMRAGLSAFASLPTTRRIAVLGEMLEIGEHALEAHLGLASALTNSNINKLFLIGPKMLALGDSLVDQITSEKFQDVDGLMMALRSELKDGDAVFVKGSNASGIGRVAGWLRTEGMAQNQAAESLRTPNNTSVRRGDL